MHVKHTHITQNLTTEMWNNCFDFFCGFSLKFLSYHNYHQTVTGLTTENTTMKFQASNFVIIRTIYDGSLAGPANCFIWSYYSVIISEFIITNLYCIYLSRGGRGETRVIIRYLGNSIQEFELMGNSNSQIGISHLKKMELINLEFNWNWSLLQKIKS